MAKALAIYPYHDASGQLVRQKLRYPNKQFCWQHPVEGGWVDTKGDEPPVLYNLRGVLRAVQRGRVVHVCEGEKDADALLDKGHAATTPPSFEPWPPGLAEPLRGAHVRLYWDRDADGHKRAHWALRALLAVGALVTCWRAVVGKDVADHLAAGLGVHEFVQADPPQPQNGALKSYTQDEEQVIATLVAESGPAAELVETVLRIYQDAVTEGETKLLSDEDILALPTPKWLVQDIIPAKGVTAVWGLPGRCKSTLGEDIQDQVRRGGDWNGFSVRQGAVLHYAGEGASQHKNRILALRAARGSINGGPPRRLTQDHWDITSLAGLAKVVQDVYRVQQLGDLVLVEFDPVGFFGPRERDGVEDTEMFAKATRALALGVDCAVLVFQHANAMGLRGRGTDHLRMYSEAYCRMEDFSRDIVFSHDGKNRNGPLMAVRFEKATAGPGIVLNAKRGMAGDEYTPEDVAREKAEMKTEAKAKRVLALEEDPERWEQMLGVLPSMGDEEGMSIKVAAGLASMGKDEARAVLGVLVRDGKVRRADGPRNAIWHWRV